MSKELELDKNKILELLNDTIVDESRLLQEVAIIAETVGHHPNWSNSYSFVKIELTTHDLGGLSYSDIGLAKKINEVIHTKNNQLLN